MTEGGRGPADCLPGFALAITTVIPGVAYTYFRTGARRKQFNGDKKSLPLIVS